jgi:predicted RNA-binding protein with PUA-like domain
MSRKRYWLFKSEPSSYSIDDLEKDKRTHWDGVRNFQARNILRDDVQEGDGVLFYHSNTNPPAIVGLAEVVRRGYPDHTQFEQGHPKFDPGASDKQPRWFMVDIAFIKKCPTPLPLESLRGEEALADMELLRKGSRLSIQPVTAEEWTTILRLAGL